VYDDETLALAEKVGLEVRDVPREVQGDEMAGRNEKWMAIPY
jgi:hypothetical protein